MKKIIFCLTLPVLLAGCTSPHILIMTGTSLGLHCTPGDGSSTPPQVSLAYKRTEVAVVPTSGKGATVTETSTNDAYSTLAGFDFKSHFFGTASLQQFISTGFASRNLLDNPKFTSAFGQTTP